MSTFFQCGSKLYPVAHVTEVDTSEVETKLWVRVSVMGEDPITLKGPDTIRFLMVHYPSALEGRRLRWVRHAWALHNLVGHPLMQVLAWVRRPHLGVWVHDKTIPSPRGLR